MQSAEALRRRGARESNASHRREDGVTDVEETGKGEIATTGILMLDTRFPRALGDIGNPATFPGVRASRRWVPARRMDQVIGEARIWGGVAPLRLRAPAPFRLCGSCPLPA